MRRPRKTSEAASGVDCWELFHSVLPHAQRVLLYGPPGTGKTHQASRTGVKNANSVFSITLTEETPAAELRGFYVPKGNEFCWQDGPAISSWRSPVARLVLNEIDHASADCLSLLYVILDDLAIARLTLPSGETVRPSEGFTVIATMNGDPQNLPTALQDRFALRIYIDKIHPEALKGLPKDVATAALRTAVLPEDRRVSIRGWQLFANLRDKVGEKTAALAVFQERASDVLVALKIAQA